MKRLEKIKLILEEFENVKQTFPGIKRIDALKRAIIKIKFLEKNEYEENGELVGGLIGHHNPNDWTY
jgi:hypothetical protein